MARFSNGTWSVREMRLGSDVNIAEMNNFVGGMDVVRIIMGYLISHVETETFQMHILWIIWIFRPSGE